MFVEVGMGVFVSRGVGTGVVVVVGEGTGGVAVCCGGAVHETTTKMVSTRNLILFAPRSFIISTIYDSDNGRWGNVKKKVQPVPN